jgi:hypothetical protein
VVNLKYKSPNLGFFRHHPILALIFFFITLFTIYCCENKWFILLLFHIPHLPQRHYFFFSWYWTIIGSTHPDLLWLGIIKPAKSARILCVWGLYSYVPRARRTKRMKCQSLTRCCTFIIICSVSCSSLRHYALV